MHLLLPQGGDRFLEFFYTTSEPVYLLVELLCIAEYEPSSSSCQNGTKESVNITYRVPFPALS